jgi:hypothetical protein
VKGPLAFLGRGEISVLNSQLAAVDAMAEADTGARRADKATLAAGQAAVDKLNILLGKQS